MGNYQTILGAVMYCPQCIPELYKRLDPKIIHSILSKLIPYSVGLEIECAGGVTKNLMLPDTDNVSIVRDYLIKHYNVMDISIDSYHKFLFSSSMINEHRIRIKDHSQLIGLYHFLEDMKESCHYTESGIHMHIDMSDIYKTGEKLKKARTGLNESSIDSLIKRSITEFMTKQLDRIDKIVGGYTGSFNKKVVTSDFKMSWVNIRPGYRSIEFRTLPMSFEYHQIITWIIELSRIVKELKQHLSNIFNDKIVFNPNYKIVIPYEDKIALKASDYTYKPLPRNFPFNQCNWEPYNNTFYRSKRL